MAITKDEASDLKSLIDRLTQVKLEHQTATRVMNEAQRQLDVFLYRLEHPEQTIGKE